MQDANKTMCWTKKTKNNKNTGFDLYRCIYKEAFSAKNLGRIGYHGTTQVISIVNLYGEMLMYRKSEVLRLLTTSPPPNG